MDMNELLVVAPHSGILIPNEIPFSSLAEDFPSLMLNVDWYTNLLYDFRDFYKNAHLDFPYCSLIVEANRHPDRLEDCVPLKDAFGKAVYRPGREPAPELRRTLADKYLRPFHGQIEQTILSGKTFMLDGHSTITARGMENRQIELMNFQFSSLEEEPKYFCPNDFIEAYADALQKRLPDIRVTVNQSEYYTVYGHVCGVHSVNARGRAGNRVPAILQETNQYLYMNADRTPNTEAIDALRRVFAESLQEMFTKVSHGENR